MMKTNLWIYDLETFKHIFCGVFCNIITNEVKVFEISSRRNDWLELKKFLFTTSMLAGFNNMGFDYPVLHKMINYESELTSIIIYGFAQEIIKSERSQIWDPLIPQLDLFLIHHYNNKARMVSLKWLEFSLRWKKVQDLPFKYNASINVQYFDDVITYCKNDVDFTFDIFKKSKNKINFRLSMEEKLNHKVLNYSDVKIGEHINRINYEKLSNRNFSEFRYLSTKHEEFKLSDIIPERIEFKTKIFNDFFDSIKNETIIPVIEKGKRTIDFERIITLPNISIKFALGGLHSEDKPRIVNNIKGYLSELDINSMYPWTIVSESIYPAHLGPEWNEGIRKSYFYRADVLKPQLKKLKKGTPEYQKIDDEQEGYKLSLNGGKP